MFGVLLGVFIAWFSAVIGSLKKVSSDEVVRVSKFTIKEKFVGYALIAAATVGLAWQVGEYFVVRSEYHKVQEELKKTKKIIEVADASLFDEASGGSAVGELAYIVDDEKPKIFKLGYYRGKDDERYQLLKEIPLTQRGERVLTDAKCQVQEVIEKDCVEDLEAAAVRPSDTGAKRIVLITSHSNTQNGKIEPSRQRLLDVSLEDADVGEVKRAQSGLRESIVTELKKISEEQGDERLQRVAEGMQNKDAAAKGRIDGLQIEGLAIDESDYAYIGIRKPLVRKGDANLAIVLRAKLEELFTGAPHFDAFLLNLANNNYGISSIDYDVRSKQLLILGNHPEGQWLTPVFCQWRVGGVAAGEINSPPCSVLTFKSTNPVVSKPELLLLPPASLSNRIYMYLDTDEKAPGGLIPYERDELGIAEE